MKRPLSYRKEIPFFCVKTEKDFQKDVYESYDNMVLRQSALHLADKLWEEYPMQGVFDFADEHFPNHPTNIVEIGCGVGRWIATLAQTYPQTICWGMDYSYQMLKRASEFWVLGKDISIDLSKKGFLEPLLLKGRRLTNLNFGLSKAEDLPFSENSQDLIVNSFLLDRLDNPSKGLTEMYRVLRPNGKLILVTPLNFTHSNHWKTLYPPNKIYDLLIQIGFSILDWKDKLLIEEPLDFRGNKINWKCLAFVASKPK